MNFLRVRRALLAFMVLVVIVRFQGGGGWDYVGGFVLGVMFGMFLDDDMHERVRGG